MMCGSVGAMFGQALAHLCPAAPGLALYLIVSPRIYGQMGASLLDVSQSGPDTPIIGMVPECQDG